MSIAPAHMPICLCNPHNFDGSSGKAKAFLHQLNILVTQQTLVPSDEHKIAYAVSLLSDSAADWAVSFAANESGYLFSSWDDFVRRFCQYFISPVPTLSALSGLLEIKQGGRSVTKYAAEFSNLVTQAELADGHAVQLFLKGFRSRYNDLAVLTLKQSEHDGLSLAALVSYIVTVLATRDAVLNPASDHSCSSQQQPQLPSRPHGAAQQNPHSS